MFEENSERSEAAMTAETQGLEITDNFWQMVEPLIPEKKRRKGRKYLRKPGGGRKPIEPKKVLEAIVYVLKNRIQWKALPKELFGSSSSIHAYFKEWESAGLFKKIWKKGLAEYDDLNGIAWECLKLEGEGAQAETKKKRHPKMHLRIRQIWRPIANRRNSRKPSLTEESIQA